MAESRERGAQRRCGPYYLLLGLLAILIPALVLVPWWIQWHDYRQTAVEVAERVARYQRLLAGEDALRSRLAAFNSQLKQRGYFIEAGNSELAAAEIQQFVKTLVEKSGGTLVSTQHLPGGQDAQWLRPVEIKVRLKGDVESLARILFGLESSNPVLAVEDVSIRSRRTLKGPRKSRVEGYSLDVNFRVVGYLMGSAP